MSNQRFDVSFPRDLLTEALPNLPENSLLHAHISDTLRLTNPRWSDVVLNVNAMEVARIERAIDDNFPPDQIAEDAS